ncbi:hypothetical protein KL930_000125 [Ogataea haglerorum]|uniref:C2H2-type domain-containing protein n=1 Tax=Ogataea haglerorum TaxID=1937702 RepID=A0AAN6D5C3_9ASCO|nr:uncharacterized protein KL911_001008 [Ogataea haglerorum]KAG7697820.1 hypothetical protein KL951_002394 [Ogataea haglerorum]KAG7701421.1 hypothetical protein KL915_000452 [Ogataea haglerorum]KAG7706640.1 hypothetical protein KL950_003305 [Ogataea haglerorum]KAG7727162.1 hypothetical protein KL933_002871 [Ogataea haglerorum]KAG7758032.1 hypothetical protein KL911_001008 [Ogataea haglerorum]
MSSTDSYGRRTWDEAEYAERARQRQQQGNQSADLASQKNVRKFFESRREQLEKVEKFNSVTFVGSMNAKEASFFCDVCNRRFKDDLKFVEHLNSKEHLVNSGFSHESELQREVTLEQVKERLRQLKAKMERSREKAPEVDFATGVQQMREKYEQQKQKKKAKKRKRQERQDPDVDAEDLEVKKLMGFGSFKNKDEKREFRISNLKDASLIGLNSVTLAFLTNDRYEEIEQWIDDIRQFPGQVIISIGGATGEYPSDCRSVEEEASRLIELVARAGFTGIDLDIEGTVLERHSKVAKIAKIINLVQSHFGEQFYVSLTLPIEFEGGLNDDALWALNMMISSKVHLNVVNAMIMDYYTKLPHGSNWGAENIRVLKEMNRQLRLNLHLTEEQAWRMTGLCPMIGYNDDNTVFSLEDFDRVLAFAKSKNVALVTYWAINRDQVAPTRDMLKLKKNVYAFSNAQSRDLEYCRKVQDYFH